MKLPKQPVPLWPDAGKIIGLSRSKMFELAASGELPTVKVGRRRMVAPKAIDGFVRRHATKSGNRPKAAKVAKVAKATPRLRSVPTGDATLADGGNQGGEQHVSGGLGERGQRLWDEYSVRLAGEEADLVLLEEVCRTADRLDKLDGLLRGDADVWCRLVHNLRTEDYELKIDMALIEARQQGAALRQLIAALPLKEAGRDGDHGEGDVETDWTANL